VESSANQDVDTRGQGARIQAAFWRRPWLRASALLTPPLAWFVVIYLASLAVLLITAFWQINPFTTNIEKVWSLDNFKLIFTTPAYRAIIFRTVGIAAGVTVVDAIIAFPFGYYMARVASSRTRVLLFTAILVPLWASYLARVYAWILVFNHQGVLNWTLAKFGLGPLDLAYTNKAVFITFCYVWLPFMVIPVYAALERIPNSLMEASADLGGRGWRTTRQIVLPLALPGVVAGAIFTFSLTMGDFIIPELVGGKGSSFIGRVIEESVGISNNVPFGAALAMVPIAIMAVFLLVAKRLGAFEAL
jgi:putative spermidine/putrescine transport system permease protein